MGITPAAIFAIPTGTRWSGPCGDWRLRAAAAGLALAAPPPGFLISPPRYGWIGVWGTFPGWEAHLPALTATLECPGVEIPHGGRRGLADDRLPRRTAAGTTFQPGVRPGTASTRSTGRGELVAEKGFRNRERRKSAGGLAPTSLLQTEPRQSDQWSESNARAALAALLPPGARVDEAIRLAVDEEGPEGGEVGFAVDRLETFANYLGIRDAAWDPREDWEVLSSGEYEDGEGLPEGWEQFLVTPATRWNLEPGDP